MHFWRSLVQRFSPMLLALSIVLFANGAPLHAAPATTNTTISSASHCDKTQSATINLPSASDCLSHCALPAPLSTSSTTTTIQSERYAAPLIAWLVVSLAPPSPPPRSDS